MLVLIPLPKKKKAAMITATKHPFGVVTTPSTLLKHRENPLHVEASTITILAQPLALVLL